MIRYFLLGCLGMSLMTGCQQKKSDATTSGDTTATAANPTEETVASVGNPVLLATLPDKYNTPDGLALAPDGTVYLSVPNLADNTYPGVLLKIVGDSVQFVSDLPAQPDTKHACPMDLAFGPDGNLYYAENQYENSKEYKSRLMCISMKGGKAGPIKPVVTGLALGNAVVWKGNTLYLTDSQWDMPTDTTGSAIFRFTLDELTKAASGSPIMLKPKTMDPHVLTTFTTKVNETGLDNGADGMDYDSQGNLYTGSFGDGTLYKVTLKADGTFASKEVLKVNKPNNCVDGLIIDRATNTMYFCNSRDNAIMTINLADGTLNTLAQNGNTDGKDGRLDQPAEVLLKGRRLYISNYDKPEKKFVNRNADEVHTMSYIDLK
ncbi:SMP-30/gluconolactonase/LRE family protein [Fibrella forsythiae]|uniref:SMP-30/gluconolactonase/LRE family protein n=1 Tax=Fibrella forsythiae TaxID=2817061 RepID=A0ABS3JR82_9BACT|nr:SMP-30/gluconolactonase/LRE family protein [Fibrella forsythiae]MBO0951886.1 SMP-30/gluconolactonase/LRE family protein [Fibrella forsythiae]